MHAPLAVWELMHAYDDVFPKENPTIFPPMRDTEWDRLDPKLFITK